MRLASAIYYDVKNQYRSGFYFAYLIVCLIYIAALRQFPAHITKQITTIIIFIDPSILGFYFIGGLILLEKRQRTLYGLFITPMSVSEYLLSKAISLTLLAILSSVLIAFSVIGTSINLALFIFTIILSSILFVFIGIAVVVRVPDLNHYLFLSALPMIVIAAPILDYLEVIQSNLFYLSPAHPVLNLLSEAISDAAEISYINFMAIAIWLIIGYFWARKWFQTYVVEKTGA